MSASHSRGARAIADVSEGVILATVDIAAPPERVFRALSSDEITRWWGAPDLYRTTEWVGELRPGGSWRARGVGADGKPFGVEGEFIEIDPPRKLVQTWRPDWDGGAATKITYRLREIAGGTQVTIRHEGFGAREESCRGHGEGWSRVLGWLAAYAAPRAEPAVASRFFMCRLVPPRATFAQDMSDAERAVMMKHATYWTELTKQGVAIVFGPVADPKGAWGLGIVRTASDEGLRRLCDDDPAIASNIGLRYDVLPMIRAVLPEGH